MAGLQQLGTDAVAEVVAEPEATAPRALSPRTTTFALVLLALVSMLNVIDRKIVGILAEAIKTDLQLTDTQMGFLTGFAFSICYALCAIPIARFADRGDRARILAVALAFWSIMTALCGMAGTYARLVLARMGVAVGEAACSPVSYSLVADYYPPHHRAKAMSVVTIATAIGTLLAFGLGGQITQAFSWQVAFMVVGFPGVALAVVLWIWLPEPRRGRPAAQDDGSGADRGAIAAIRGLLSKPALNLLIFGASMLTLALSAQLIWTASFFQRTYGWSVGTAGIALGVTFGVGGVVAPLVSSYLGDHRLVRDRGAYPRVIALLTLLALPCLGASLLATSAAVSIFLIGLTYALTSGWPPNTLAAVRLLVGSGRMALATALLGVAINVVGIGLGPFIVGFLADLMQPRLGSEALRFALLASCLTAYAAAIAAFWLAARLIGREEAPE